ncbi:cytochrome P450 [Corynespora cassiicola Philippines]|uniref:Cytochrome P450 n=1 Tax=Corynespora cassiicola Philippines TaxID=1448308 RepID=A0A2T2N2M9_CORCC|nr:cytochrome P450 [Corynespora cassiicola Philippines]
MFLFAAAFLTYRLFVVFYRLFLSPIAKFPGPQLAGATSLYGFYFNLVRKGRYVFEIERMHNIYAPIVRINPHELSIRDPEFYDRLYVSGSVRPTESYNHFVEGVDFQGSHFLTIPHDLHRLRRKPLEPYFSKMGIRHLEPLIHDIVEKLTKPFEKLERNCTVVRLDHAMLCYTGEVISNVFCENPTCLLDNENFSSNWYESLHTIVKSMPLFESFPGLINGIVRLIPESILTWVDPRSQLFNDWRDMAERHVLQAKSEVKYQDKSLMEEKRPTFLLHLASSNLPESELSVARLVKEAQVLLGAGALGTSRILDIACYYIMADPLIQSKIADELERLTSAWSVRKPTWVKLEKGPYFQGCVKESSRMGYGVMRRLPRISPRDDIYYREWITPRKVPVGMSSYMQHTDPTVFPSPFEFVPERWLPQNVTPAMQRNFVPFTKGSRNCIRTNLAYAEMNHLLAALFRKGGLKFQLHQTTKSDVVPFHDFVVSLPKSNSKGIKMIFL